MTLVPELLHRSFYEDNTDYKIVVCALLNVPHAPSGEASSRSVSCFFEHCVQSAELFAERVREDVSITFSGTLRKSVASLYSYRCWPYLYVRTAVMSTTVKENTVFAVRVFLVNRSNMVHTLVLRVPSRTNGGIRKSDELISR